MSMAEEPESGRSCNAMSADVIDRDDPVCICGSNSSKYVWLSPFRVSFFLPSFSCLGGRRRESHACPNGCTALTSSGLTCPRKSPLCCRPGTDLDTVGALVRLGYGSFIFVERESRTSPNAYPSVTPLAATPLMPLIWAPKNPSLPYLPSPCGPEIKQCTKSNVNRALKATSNSLSLRKCYGLEPSQPAPALPEHFTDMRATSRQPIGDQPATNGAPPL
ncbi:hypothetical protein EDB81DRAFT_220883 [Dactylonectria macrodidyma]|uniref:Uncharacterized protein n=1 Tax=Dactylonectria macrodidyma TaxID=307937 RepID=A0A9P9DRP2_9HYPO|nr:hypothetical protein EDB81DRAFT_220883 [Dactylonectria macrodidyma]